MTHLRIALRGFLMVTLVACNTRQLALGHLSGAVLVGFCISALWWTNSSKDRPEVAGGSLAYGFGAACGTMAGFWLAGLFGGG